MAEIKVQCPGCDAAVKAQPGVPKIRCPRCRTVIVVAEQDAPAKPLRPSTGSGGARGAAPPQPSPPKPEAPKPAGPKPSGAGMKGAIPPAAKPPLSQGGNAPRSASQPSSANKPPASRPLGGKSPGFPSRPASSSKKPVDDDDEILEIEAEDWEEADEIEDDEVESRPAKRSKKSGGWLSTPKQGSKKAKKRRPAQAMSETNQQQLMSFGLLLVGLGVASFILPLVGLQVKGLHRMAPEHQMMGGGMLIGFGALALVFSFLGAIPGFADTVRSGFKLGCLFMGGSGLLACGGCVGYSLIKPMFRGNNDPPQMAPFGPGFRPGANPGGAPNRGPGFVPPANMPDVNQQFAAYSTDQILNVTLLGFPSDQLNDVQNRLRELTGAKVSSGSGQGGTYQVRMAPVTGDFSTLRDQIDSFATVRHSSPVTRQIVLIPKRGGTAPSQQTSNDFGTAGGGTGNGSDPKSMPQEDSPFKPATATEDSPFKPADDGDSPFKPTEENKTESKPTSDGDSPFKPAGEADSPFKPAGEGDSPFKPTP